ncbi:MAG: PAS domain-containing sensor histidine kinase [Rhodospirillales bacterium]|nr:PAS domain-containing sensor histidine kinase [Rhodospirillales bacterium]
MEEKAAVKMEVFLKTGFLRNIVVVSLCIAVLFPVISRFVIYPQFAELLIESTEEEAARAASYLSTGLLPGPDGITIKSLSITYAAEADEIKKAFGLIKYKVFAKTGLTVFSTERKDIGVLNGNDYFHQIVSNGRTYTKLVRKDTKSLENQSVTRDVIETYVPIINDGNFVGAFEIYYDITDRLAKIDRLLLFSSLVLILMTAGLLLAVGWTVSGAIKATIDRDRAEETLRKSHVRFKDFAEAASDWFWEMDKNLRWSFFSDRFSEISGVPSDLLIGKAFNEFRLTDVDPVRQNQFLETLANHEPFRNFEYKSTFEDGRVVFLSISAHPVFNSQGLFEGYRGSGTDITNTKKAAIAKSQFVSTVSHELRTPLTSINGALGLMSHNAFGNMTDEGKNLISIAQNNCNQLMALVSDLLDFEKLDTGGKDFRFEKLDVVKLVRETVENNVGLASRYGVRISLINLVNEAMVIGDSDRLTQVIGNLLSNAAKFSKDDNSIEVSVEKKSSDVIVSVRDYGKGISEAFKKTIFDRFTQEDSSDTREKGGTGLGLNISKTIIEYHGGTIWFESQEGSGSTFFFRLPVTEN